MSRRWILVGGLFGAIASIVVVVGVLAATGGLPGALQEPVDWRLAELSGTRGSYEDYLDDHPDGAHADQARGLIEAIRFADIRAGAEVEVIRAFLSDYPSSLRKAEVERYLHDAVWASASKADSVEALTAYAAEYPADEHTSEATSRVDGLLFKVARDRGDEAALAAFVAQYPASRHLDEAKELLEDVVWAKAEASDVAPSLKDYLTRYPEGRYASKARDRVDDLAWKAVTASSGEAGLVKYLTEFAGGRHAEEAATALDNLRWGAAEGANTVRSYAKYIATAPAGQRATDAAARSAALARDDAPYSTAAEAGKAALEAFLLEYPGHRREAEARARIVELSLGKITGTLAWRDGRALIMSYTVGLYPESGSGRPSFQTPVSGSGDFTISRVPTGTYTLSIVGWSTRNGQSDLNSCPGQTARYNTPTVTIRGDGATVTVAVTLSC